MTPAFVFARVLRWIRQQINPRLDDAIAPPRDDRLMPRGWSARGGVHDLLPVFDGPARGKLLPYMLDREFFYVRVPVYDGMGEDGRPRFGALEYRYRVETHPLSPRLKCYRLANDTEGWSP